MKASSNSIRVPALEVRQGPKQHLYSFSIDGKLVHNFAAISRVKRADGGELHGYQRPEVLSHIAEIRDFVEGNDPMIPNAVVLAFNSKVRFEPATKDYAEYSSSRPGTLVIPYAEGLEDSEKPGFIVDGQQRLAAVRDADVPSFPLCVTAFITNDLKEQTEQFILVNSTKPLPKGLIYELLPNTEARLPSTLAKRRFPAELLHFLNRDERSPMRGMIQTPTNPEGTIKDNSVLRMLENSLTDGLLYRFRSDGPTAPVAADMLATLYAFWGAVREIFPDAWEKPPKKSRLVHGAGILSMGFLMDAVGDRHRVSGRVKKELFAADLVPLKSICRWTDGYWEFGPGQQRKWNEIQNTPRDIQLLTNYLLVQYKGLVWNATQKPAV